MRAMLHVLVEILHVSNTIILFIFSVVAVVALLLLFHALALVLQPNSVLYIVIQLSSQCSKI